MNQNKPFKLLGLDLSSTVMGIAIIDSKCAPGNHLFSLKHLNLSKYETIKQKTDVLSECFREIFSDSDITCCGLEECLKGFSNGFSRPDVLITLGQISALCQYILMRDYPHIQVKLLNVRHARSVCLGKLLKSYKNTVYKTEKNYVFEWFRTQYPQWIFPLKEQKPKSKKIEFIPESKDMVDAFIIAMATLKEL